MVAFVSTLLLASIVPALSNPFHRYAIESRDTTLSTPISFGTTCQYSMIAQAAITLGATSFVLSDSASASVIAGAAITGFESGFKTSTGTGTNLEGRYYASGANSHNQAFSEMNTLFSILINEATTNNNNPTAGGTVTPGVYSYSGIANIPAGLKLTGSATDIFIFKSAGAMNFAASTVITLDGVLPSNVFWVSNAAINVGGTSNIPGVFSAVGAITVGASCTMNAIFQSSAAITIGASSNISPPIFGAGCSTSVVSIPVIPQEPPTCLKTPCEATICPECTAPLCISLPPSNPSPPVNIPPPSSPVSMDGPLDYNPACKSSTIVVNIASKCLNTFNYHYKRHATALQVKIVATSNYDAAVKRGASPSTCKSLKKTQDDASDAYDAIFVVFISASADLTGKACSAGFVGAHTS